MIRAAIFLLMLERRAPISPFVCCLSAFRFSNIFARAATHATRHAFAMSPSPLSAEEMPSDARKKRPPFAAASFLHAATPADARKRLPPRSRDIIYHLIINAPLCRAQHTHKTPYMEIFLKTRYYDVSRAQRAPCCSRHCFSFSFVSLSVAMI